MSKAFIIALKEEVNNIDNINGYPVLFSGIGKINATIGTHELIRMGVSEIINIGSCGSTQHQLGEIIKIGKVCQDIDCSPICEYGITAFEESQPYILLDENSSHTCFTTDYFYDHHQKEKYAPNYINMIESSSVFDMELYAIAKTCLKKNIKLSSYKWVSDDGDFSKWMENCEVSLKKVMTLLT